MRTALQRLNDLLERELIRLETQSRHGEDTTTQDGVVSGILLSIEEVRSADGETADL